MSMTDSNFRVISEQEANQLTAGRRRDRGNKWTVLFEAVLTNGQVFVPLNGARSLAHLASNARTQAHYHRISERISVHRTNDGAGIVIRRKP